MARATRAEWAERVGKWRASGQTAREFAASAGLNPTTLLWWSSQLRAASKPAASFVELKLAPGPVPPQHRGNIEVVVADDLAVRVSGDFDPTVLRRVVDTLRSR